MYYNKIITVVIPAFNEEKYIADVIVSIPNYVDNIYVIDDGSTDGTYDKAFSVSNYRKCIKIIRHEHNQGVGSSIADGYKRCLSDGSHIIATIDGDNQMDPNQLQRLIDPILMDIADYTKGDRTSVWKNLKYMPHWRRFGNLILRYLTRIASGNYEVNDPQNGYTVCSINVLKILELDHIFQYYGCYNDILIKLSASNARVLEIPMAARYQDEISNIKYKEYILKVLMLLVRDFFWRLKKTYFK